MAQNGLQKEWLAEKRDCLLHFGEQDLISNSYPTALLYFFANCFSFPCESHFKNNHNNQYRLNKLYEYYYALYSLTLNTLEKSNALYSLSEDTWLYT